MKAVPAGTRARAGRAGEARAGRAEVEPGAFADQRATVLAALGEPRLPGSASRRPPPWASPGVSIGVDPMRERLGTSRASPRSRRGRRLAG